MDELGNTFLDNNERFLLAEGRPKKSICKQKQEKVPDEAKKNKKFDSIHTQNRVFFNEEG